MYDANTQPEGQVMQEAIAAIRLAVSEISELVLFHEKNAENQWPIRQAVRDMDHCVGALRSTPAQPRERTHERTGIKEELTQFVNRHSLENGSDTPDFILAQFMLSCLLAFEASVQQREAWYGRPTRQAEANDVQR